MHDRYGPFFGPLPSIDVIGTGRSLAQQIFSPRMPLLPGVAEYSLSYIAYTNVANTFTVTPQTIICDTDSHKGLIVKGHSATQSANLEEWQSSAGDAGVLVGPVGGATRPGIQVYNDSGTLVFSSPHPGNNLYSFFTNIALLAGGQITNVGAFSCSTVDANQISSNPTAGSSTSVITSFLTTVGFSGAAGAGMGGTFGMRAKSSTTAARYQAEINHVWKVATDASRTGRLILGAHDAATSVGSPRVGISASTNGAVPMLQFFGSGSEVVQQSGDMATGLVALGLFSSATGGSGTPGGTNGQIQYNNSSNFGGFTASGDATINTTTGAVAVTKTAGVAFAASATIDATNANNITNGSLPNARLQNSSLTVNSAGGISGGGAVALGAAITLTGTLYDMLSTFVSSVTNTTNADATLAYGILSFFKATTGAHNATLPAPSAGKIIALQIDPTSTKLVTLVRSGTEKIDGVAASQVFFATESVILRTDGTDWFTIGGKRVAMLAEMYVVSTSQAALTTATPAQLLYDTTTLDNTGLMCSTGASTITIQRSGNYELSINTSLGGAADGNTTLTVNLSLISPINNNSGTWSTNRIVQAFGTGIIGGYGSGTSPGVVALTAGDVLRGWVYPIFVGVASVYYLGGNPTFTLFSAKEVL